MTWQSLAMGVLKYFPAYLLATIMGYKLNMWQYWAIGFVALWSAIVSYHENAGAR